MGGQSTHSFNVPQVTTNCYCSYGHFAQYTKLFSHFTLPGKSVSYTYIQSQNENLHSSHICSRQHTTWQEVSGSRFENWTEKETQVWEQVYLQTFRSHKCWLMNLETHKDKHLKHQSYKCVQILRYTRWGCSSYHL